MLHTNTTRPQLLEVLTALLTLPQLEPFRLVGGTALSLLKGHRDSVDIDLFTNRKYGTTDFAAILERLQATFPIVEDPSAAFPALKALENHYGLQLAVGYTPDDLVKTDILYHDIQFLGEPLVEEGIRLATLEEIGAMKLDVVSRGGRKKDFWDLAEIFEDYPLIHLLEVYRAAYPWHQTEPVIEGLCRFEVAEEMPDPICLRGYSWESIKERIQEEAGKL